MQNEPARSENAVLLPREMAAMPTLRITGTLHQNSMNCHASKEGHTNEDCRRYWTTKSG